MRECTSWWKRMRRREREKDERRDQDQEEKRGKRKWLLLEVAPSAQ